MQPIPVTLIRGLSEQMDSMRRFGAAMESGLGSRPDIELHALRMRPSPRAGPDPVGRVHRNIDEFVRFPALVRAGAPPAAGIVHLTDSAHAHVLSQLPADRTVVSCHDVRELRVREVDPGTQLRDGLLRVRLRVHLRGLATAAAVVCSSTAARRDIAELAGVPQRRISVIPKGVGDEFTVLPAAERERVRAELGGGRLIVSVTSGERWKNLPAVIETVAALRAEGIDAKLVRVGAPVAYARDLLGDAMLDLGRVSDRRLVELYNAGDVLLFPSLLEGFGRPPVEAMACGLPVVASSAEPFAEVLGDAALLPDPHDTRAITAATRAVLCDASLAGRLRERGLARSAGYTWAATVAAYVDVYRTLGGAA